MTVESRRHSAPAERNKGPIMEQLLRLLPERGLMLEIASGTGQHAAHAAAALPLWQWQPSDLNPSSLPSVASWCEGLPNVRAPLLLDVTEPVWAGVAAQVDAIFCANMLHIAPWGVCPALMRGAARHLSADGLLLLYGPYLVDGEPFTDSNRAFDADLRGRDPSLGLRKLSDVLAQAEAVGLTLRERVAMPANNLLLVLARSR